VNERILPRLVIAGLSGDAGKTLLSVGLTLACRARGLDVRAFKKGPDYIDAAWLAWASGHPARNLDTFLATVDDVTESFVRHAVARPAVTSSDPAADRTQYDAGAINIIEGNRGLFDGVDAAGTHSSAALARALSAPVLLIVNARKMTRTAAACVLGCRALDPALTIGGVVLNQLAGARHEAVAREAIERDAGVPVLGAIPRVDDAAILPGRHLGLVPPAEHPDIERVTIRTREIIERHVDVDRVLRVAAAAPVLSSADAFERALGAPDRAAAPDVTIGYVSDAAFSFYYPENLEALQSHGARLVPIPALGSTSLPGGLDALYIGGGFPEVHGRALAENTGFHESLRQAAARGLPIYAECGGLMLLARSMTWQGCRYEMAGVFPVDVEVHDKPQGHGYAVLRVDRPNPFFAVGTEIKGHEFHYSSITGTGPTACAVLRGAGCGDHRDALTAHNVWASYTHVHAVGLPMWTAGMVSAARRFRDSSHVR
jgi:cobyrinic acid a,c-diamide synthase